MSCALVGCVAQGTPGHLHELHHAPRGVGDNDGVNRRIIESLANQLGRSDDDPARPRDELVQEGLRVITSSASGAMDVAYVIGGQNPAGATRFQACL